MKKVITDIIHQLVDVPEEVKITELIGTQTLVYELRCHKKDIGKVIGKNGKTINALRNIANVMAARYGKKAALEIIE